MQKDIDLPDDFNFQTGISDNEISKRRLESASKTFAKLKSTFLTLAKPQPKPQPKARVNRFSGWGWGGRRRRRTG
jgi:hypothetical protein